MSIKPARESNCHEVLLSIGGERQMFKFTTEVNQVGDRLPSDCYYSDPSTILDKNI
ncbi:MAG: hypothetical protein SXA11_05320 [Cyanobacteriota bacterium]|nr:hypothetical protein [Cyanobacteriota bacterium]